MKHKIAFFDMDGTVYQTEKDIISDSTLAAISQLKNAGYIVAAATGRPLNQLKLILERVNFDYYVLINGGYILDKDFNIIASSKMAEEDVESVLDMVNQNDLGLLFHFGDSTYIYNDFYPAYYFSKYANVLDSLFYDPTQTQHQRHDVYNAVVLTKHPDIVQNFMDEHPNLRMDLINIKTDGLAYDIFNASTDKAHGIETILDLLGLTWKDTIVFGDSTNDIGMLDKADIGVVMGQATDKVKSHADIVTEPIYYHGIYNAVKKILASEDDE